MAIVRRSAAPAARRISALALEVRSANGVRASSAASQAFLYYWLRVSDFVDPAEYEQSDGDTGSPYRYKESVALTTKKRRGSKSAYVG